MRTLSALPAHPAHHAHPSALPAPPPASPSLPNALVAMLRRGRYPAAGQCHPAAGQCHPAAGQCHPAAGQCHPRCGPVPCCAAAANPQRRRRSMGARTEAPRPLPFTAQRADVADERAHGLRRRARMVGARRRARAHPWRGSTYPYSYWRVECPLKCSQWRSLRRCRSCIPLAAAMGIPACVGASMRSACARSAGAIAGTVPFHRATMRRDAVPRNRAAILRGRLAALVVPRGHPCHAHRPRAVHDAVNGGGTASRTPPRLPRWYSPAGSCEYSTRSCC
jgi:hypothetical protein